MCHISIFGKTISITKLSRVRQLLATAVQRASDRDIYQHYEACLPPATDINYRCMVPRIGQDGAFTPQEAWWWPGSLENPQISRLAQVIGGRLTNSPQNEHVQAKKPSFLHLPIISAPS